MMLSCDRHDCAHVGRLSIEMNRNDADGGRCDLSFDFDGINRKSFFVGVAEHDPAAGLCYCLGCRDPGMCRGDDFIAVLISCLIVRYWACRSTKGIFMTEGGGRMAEGRGQRSEVRSQKSEVRSQ